jgi:hypothetical protein
MIDYERLAEEATREHYASEERKDQLGRLAAALALCEELIREIDVEGTQRLANTYRLRLDALREKH